MRTRRLFGFTLVVLVLHALAWQLAAGGPPRFAATRAGVRMVAVVSVQQGGKVAAVAATGGDPPAPRAVRVAGRTGARVTHVAPAGDGGALPASRESPPAPRWPVYATQAPPSVSLRYAFVQSTTGAPLAGEATLEWTHVGDAFTLRLATAVAGRPPRDWESSGRFDAAGLAPGRLVERERGRDKRSVDFDRDAARVHFSSAPGRLPIAPGAQDRWSWMAQLAAIAEADAAARRHDAASRRHAAVGPWTLQVAGLRGDLERWTFRVLPTGDPPPGLPGNELSTVDDRAPGLLHVLRDPDRPYDMRIEAWLSPALHHFPAALRLSTPPGPWSLTLARTAT